MYISGALNPNSVMGIEKAEGLYNNIRKRTTDCLYVAKNSGLSLEQCNIVKNYLFNDRHMLETGYSRFMPDLAIAQSWLRLAEKNDRNIKEHDILLLKHELTELNYMISNKNINQKLAHNMAEKKYNYSLAVKNYYATLGIRI